MRRFAAGNAFGSVMDSSGAVCLPLNLCTYLLFIINPADIR